MKTHPPKIYSLSILVILVLLLGNALPASPSWAAPDAPETEPVSEEPEQVAAAPPITPALDTPGISESGLITAAVDIPASPAAADSGDWQEVGPGIAYRKFTLPTPNNVFVARMTITDTRATLETSIGMGKLITDTYTRETILGQAQRYDQALGFADGQTWGNRSRVVVAINGDYQIQDPPGNYIDYPVRGMVQSGWFARRFPTKTGFRDGSGFGWNYNRIPFIGGCVDNYSGLKNYVRFVDANDFRAIQAINMPRLENQTVLYTPQWNFNTMTDNNGIEIVIEMSRPSMLISTSIEGTITQIRDGQGSTDIPYDSVVLSAGGTAANYLRSLVQSEEIVVGGKVQVAQEITNCSDTLSYADWTKTAAGIGTAFYYLQDGVIYDYAYDAGATNPLPRTSIAYKYDKDTHSGYMYFIVVDGRDFRDGLGMTVRELAEFAKDTLGANYGATLDGGGSSTMVINGRVVNDTACNDSGFKQQDYCHYQSSSLAYQMYVPLVAGNQDGVPHMRPVVNGIMMVAVEPYTATTTFTTTQQVQVTTSTRIRLGPGSNYAAVGIAPQGATGSIATEIYKNLNGVLAKGTHWWYVDFDSNPAGWIDEQDLAPMP